MLKSTAIQYMQRENYDLAVEQLKHYISINPNEADGYNLRGLCYEKLNDFAYAVDDFKMASEIEPDDSEIINSLERVTVSLRQSTYAYIDDLKLRTEVNPNNSDYYLRLAESYMLLENFPMTERWYDEYIVLEHDSKPYEIIKLTKALAENGSFEKGENLLGLYAMKFPDNWELLLRYGYFKLWLGRNEEAVQFFQSAKSLKPFNKEIQFALDLAEENEKTNYDESILKNSNLINKYVGSLKADPNKDDVRFRLVEKLIESERYEEAYEHLKYLSPIYESSSRFNRLWDVTVDGREEYYEKLIDYYTDILDSSPSNKQILKTIVNKNNKLLRYDNSEELLKEYLENNPNDDEVIYLLAQTLSYSNKYGEALEKIFMAIELDSDNTDYKILASQIIILNNEEDQLDLAELYLNDILDEKPNEINALIALGKLSLIKQNFNGANRYANFAAQIDPNHPDLLELILSLQSAIKSENIVEIADYIQYDINLPFKSNCDDAITVYENYIQENQPGKNVLLELADLYLCSERYEDAEQIYNNIIETSYSLEVDKKRALLYYSKGDYSKASEELSRLLIEYPDDFEIQMFLADTYAQNDDFDLSREIYDSFEDDDLPDYYQIETRKDWLPSFEIIDDFSSGESSWKFITDHALTYGYLYPEAYFYSDNDDFQYSLLGTGIEVALAEYISIGGGGYRGSLKNGIGNINFMTYKGNLFYRPTPFWKFKVGAGEMFSAGKINQLILEASAEFHGATRYTKHRAKAEYLYTDAAVLLNSSGLVFNRLSTHYINLDGHYRFRKGLNIFSVYKLYLLEETEVFEANIGNSFEIKIAKEFYPDFMAGYEYYFADFKFNLPLYYAPQKFDAHSFWGLWDIYEDLEWDINLSGKIGYIPDEDHVLKGFTINAIYKGFEELLINAHGAYGETSRIGVDYKSFNFHLNARWNFLK